MEGMQEGSWQNIQEKTYRADPGSDPLESLVEKLGPEDAFDELLDKLEKDPHDPETVRQANLLLNRWSEWEERVRAKLPQQ